MPRLSGKFFVLAVASFFILFAALGNAIAAEEAALPYSVLEVVRLPGPVHWDYLTFDAERHRLFVTRGDSVDVIDVVTNKVVGTISGTSGVHGVALAPGPGYGYISDGQSNNIMIVDYATLEPIATLPAGKKPDAIIYDAVSKRVFAANGESGDLTVIDATNNQLLSAVALGGKPEAMATDGAGLLYVNLQDTGQVAVIDTAKLQIVNSYDFSAVCDGPTGLALDRDEHRLFISCRSKRMIVADAGTGRVIDALPIGAFTDAAVFDPGLKLAFSSNGDGTLTIIGPAARPGHYAVIQTLRTLPTARTMALDPATHLLYLSAAEPAQLPSPTYHNPHPHQEMKPDSFMLMIVAPQGWKVR